MTANYPILVEGMSAVVFVAVLGVEGARRPGYDPTYHTGSVLSLGDRGWIQIANILQMGVGKFAFALGVCRTLHTPVGAVPLATLGLGMVVSGAFRPDPLRGYQPGSKTGTRDEVSWHHQVYHFLGGAVAFFAIFVACLVLAGRLDGVWRPYTLLTAAVGPF